ncbi:MAG: hypothetical protein GY757_00905 [bacterium]|nr:hypothetical protein [bacterium]
MMKKAKIPLITILTLVPLIYLVWVMQACYVDIPFGDQWDFIPLLEQSYSDEVSLSELSAQHNEHRLFFPRAIMLVLAHMSGWDISFELAVNLLLGMGIFVVIAMQVYDLKKKTGISELAWSLPILSMIVFSLNQWENWVWGWQIQIFLCVLCVVIGIMLLSGEVFKWWKLVVSIFMGLIAVFSFANGLWYLVLGGGILLFNPAIKGKREKIRTLSLWAAGSAGIILLYFYNYARPARSSTGFFGFLHHPLEYMEFVFKFIGSPLTEFNRNSYVLGVLGILVYAILLRFLYKSEITFQRVLPYAALSLYSLGGALLTGIGRAGKTGDAAMSSRYAGFSIFFWIAVVIFVFLLLGEKKIPPGGFLTMKHRNYLLYFIVTVVVFHIGTVTVKSTYLAMEHRDFLQSARTEILENGGESERGESFLKRLYPPGTFGVKKRLPVLKKLKISIYREQSRNVPKSR